MLHLFLVVHFIASIDYKEIFDVLQFMWWGMWTQHSWATKAHHDHVWSKYTRVPFKITRATAVHLKLTIDKINLLSTPLVKINNINFQYFISLCLIYSWIQYIYLKGNSFNRWEPTPAHCTLSRWSSLQVCLRKWGIESSWSQNTV